ncbi:MAG: hypothetical protein RQ982_02125 [Gammaproteobacteria bacterium]|nr:hypothetical protein [Gammaproteobacteria bacterium]
MMKNMFKILAILIVWLAFSPATNAAMVSWQPTNTDVNYVYNTVAGYSLALFDVDDFDTSQAFPLMLNTGTGADSITIIEDGSAYKATSLVTTNSISLLADNQFVLAITDGNSWFEPLSWFELAADSNIYNVSFAFGSVTAIDVSPAVVPLPASLLLFGSGILALFGFVRNKAGA